MTQLEQDLAEGLALALADVMFQHLPSLFGEEPGIVVAFTTPLACSLVRAQSKAARNKKHARKYRKLQREVGEILRTTPDSPVRHRQVGQTVEFDPSLWHTQLVRGGIRRAHAGEATIPRASRPRSPHRTTPSQ
jgi:hypothetical protein